MVEIEKLATDRYRVRAHNMSMTLSAQDLLDVYGYGLLNVSILKAEAEKYSQEYEHERKYREHQYDAGD